MRRNRYRGAQKYFSLQNGTIASNIPNNGAFNYTVSNDLPETDNARLLVEAEDNIFYDICNNDFTITKNTNPEFFIVEETLDTIDCGAETAIYHFDYVTINGSSQELEQLTIYNTLGQNVTASTNLIEKSKSQLVVDLSNLNSGIYYIKTRTTTNKVVKQ